MHLEGPWLSTTGKKKGKKKFASAEHARKARELEESWKNLQKKWGIETEERKKRRAMTIQVFKPEMSYRRETPVIQSLSFTGDPCLKPEQKVYTGTKIKGIGTMHKSNAVPIFSDQEAIDIAKMRR